MTSQIFAQSERKLLHFQIVSDSSVPEGINIINLVSEQTTISDSDGRFSMYAKPDDLLVLTAVNFDYKRRIIETSDFEGNVLSIKMVAKVTQLDEVVINEYPNITSQKLGIVSKDQKKYTVAERRLETAGDFKPIHLLALLGGSMPLDPLINAITGRTKDLKKQLKVERREYLLEKIKSQFTDEYFTALKILPEDIEGFEYYLAENEAFVLAIEEKNRVMADFLIVQLSEKYLEIIALESN